VPDPRSRFVYFLVAGTVLDAKNEIPACAVKLGHLMAISTMAFLLALCGTHWTLKIEGFFYHVHGSSLRRTVRLWSGKEGISWPLRRVAGRSAKR